ncbi:MAG: hypothetical protein JSU90_00225 [Nitrospiraceae bacterium]|nr:MAG: hypothetical protein JSU90_00225 [Nitrospiraceae bacterium]
MNIDCYISGTCDSEKALRKNLTQAIGLEAADVTLTVQRITDEEAEKRGLKGSPSVLVNGRDILPGEIPGFS